MKKKLLIVAILCLACSSVKAQVYGRDAIVPMPVRELYDKNMMNSYLNAMAATAARRQELYQRYGDMAVEAFNNNQWSNVIYYVTKALDTKYYCGELYYIRGYAYEQLGNLRAAKSDYKTGKKYDSTEAAQALESIKRRMKRKK